MEDQIKWAKYSREAPFTDPLLRCHSCQKIVERALLHRMGACVCGGKKVSELRILKEGEMEEIKERFPDFAEVFEAVPDVEDTRI